jgi:hypothetical protein
VSSRVLPTAAALAALGLASALALASCSADPGGGAAARNADPAAARAVDLAFGGAPAELRGFCSRYAALGDELAFQFFKRRYRAAAPSRAELGLRPPRARAVFDEASSRCPA